jgi:hypothetical protein
MTKSSTRNVRVDVDGFRYDTAGGLIGSRAPMELEWQQYGQTIEIRPKGERHWEHVAVVNPLGDSGLGIPARADREFAELIVAAVNAYLKG